MFQYRAALARPIDGDSTVLLIDLGFGVREEAEVRLLAVRAPEKSQPGGSETTQFVAGWMATQIASGLRWPLFIETVQTKVIEPTERMTFTRYLATVWPYGRRGTQDSLNYAVATFLSGHPEWPAGD